MGDRESGARGGRLQNSKMRREALRRRQRLPKAMQKYELYQPLHQLWRQYVLDLLNLTPGKESDGRKEVSTASSPQKPSLPSSDSTSSPLVEVMMSRDQASSLI